ncbi:MAG: hypothetical protein ABIN58_06645, partial [candidate division WOR-3 bacterium]
MNQLTFMSLLIGSLTVGTLFPSEVIAGTYWVSPTGTASWAGARSETPLTGTACTSLAVANANATAGDTVYLRGGVYNTSIQPSRSGSDVSNRISFMAAPGETPVITNVGIAVYIMGKSYIRLEGISVQAPVQRLLLMNRGASYNEIANCSFSGVGSVDTPKIWDGDITGGTPCVHNWIHGSTFANTGIVTPACDDAGGFQLGVPAYDDHSNYNTIENNVFYCGGHHNLEVYTRYNVIRNNVFHHEGCMIAPNPPCPYAPDSKGYYGNRNVQLYDGNASEGMFNLFEGNRLGHAGRPPDDDGADNIALTSPKNIVRYNDSFNAASNGVYFKVGAGSYGNNNRVYNNTIYHNGHNESNGYIARFGMTFGASATVYTQGNVIKNNIVYDNYAGDFAARGGLASLGYQTISNNWLNSQGDPAFANPDISNPASTILPDLSLKATSGAIDGGSHLTQANGP